jgi:hypothetical protein
LALFREKFYTPPLFCKWLLCRDYVDRVVFCFAKPGNAREFAMRFGGEVLPVAEKPER